VTEKYKGKSDKYKGVYILQSKKLGEDAFRGQVMINGTIRSKSLPTEYDAAKWVDIQLIRNNQEPKNNTLKKQ
jgi:hypothetical protein